MSSSDNRHGRLKDRNKLYSSSGVFIVPFTTDDFFFFLGLRSLFLQHRFHRQVPFPLLLVFQQRAKLTIVSSLQNKGSDKKSRNKQCTHNNNQGLNPTQNTSDKRKLATLRLAPLCPNSSWSFSPNSLPRQNRL